MGIKISIPAYFLAAKVGKNRWRKKNGRKGGYWTEKVFVWKEESFRRNLSTYVACVTNKEFETWQKKEGKRILFQRTYLLQQYRTCVLTARKKMTLANLQKRENRFCFPFSFLRWKTNLQMTSQPSLKSISFSLWRYSLDTCLFVVVFLFSLFLLPTQFLTQGKKKRKENRK